jgi:hypothetical protein
MRRELTTWLATMSNSNRRIISRRRQPLPRSLLCLQLSEQDGQGCSAARSCRT